MTASRTSPSTSYQEHWPLPHSRSVQQRNAPPECDFGQTFREKLSASGEAPEPPKLTHTSQNPSANQETGSQLGVASEAAPKKMQGTTTESSLINVVDLKAAGVNGGKATSLNKLFAQAKAAPQTKTAAGNKATSNAGKETRRGFSREEEGSSDSQAPAAELSVSVQETAAAPPNRDDTEPDTHDAAPVVREKQDSIQIDSTDSTSAVPIAGDLAMAVRISSTSSDSAQTQGQSGTLEETAAQNFTGLHNQVQIAAAQQTQQRHEADTPPVAGAITAAQPGAANQAEKTGQAEEGKAAHVSEFETEFNKLQSEPVRGAHVQIAGTENQRIDIRLQERGGALSVTVRSSDSTLAKTLQDHAPELNARLSAEHFRTELWTPSLNRSSQERSSSSHGGQNPEHNDAGESPDQGQKRRQNQEPEWIAEFESHPAAFQKRIDYTWHQ